VPDGALMRGKGKDRKTEETGVVRVWHFLRELHVPGCCFIHKGTEGSHACMRGGMRGWEGREALCRGRGES